MKDNHLQKSERDRMQSGPLSLIRARRCSWTEEEVDRKAIHSSKAGASYLHIPKHSREIVGAGAEVEVVENIFLHGRYVWIWKPNEAVTVRNKKWTVYRTRVCMTSITMICSTSKRCVRNMVRKRDKQIMGEDNYTAKVPTPLLLSFNFFLLWGPCLKAISKTSKEPTKFKDQIDKSSNIKNVTWYTSPLHSIHKIDG